MASVVSDPNGRKRILIVAGDGSRKAIRLGKATMKQAEAFKLKVEAVVQDLTLGRPHDDEVARWLRDLQPVLRKKLERAGLVKTGGRTTVTLDAFLKEYFDVLTVKDSTKVIYGHTRRCLTTFFGEGKYLRDIDTAQAEKWRQSLKAQGLADATISRRVIIARSMFKRAMKWKLVFETPSPM